MTQLATTPSPPYYAVIFTSVQADNLDGYAEMAELMATLARQQDGYLGIESAREGVGITVSYWRDLDSIRQWRQHAEHKIAQSMGREQWYSCYQTRIALVERDYRHSGSSV